MKSFLLLLLTLPTLIQSFTFLPLQPPLTQLSSSLLHSTSTTSISNTHKSLELRLRGTALNAHTRSKVNAIQSDTRIYSAAKTLSQDATASSTPSSAIVNKRVVMKFGGSSLADASRIDHVAHLIKSQIALGNRPAAVICSAMGKTTNNLLNAGTTALTGRLSIDALRTLHLTTMAHFNFPSHVQNEVNALLLELENMLNGVMLLQELSPRSLDMLVSFGERLTARIMAARLNQIGVPAESYDSWNIGFLTTSDFGDATILPMSGKLIKDTFANKIDPNTVAVVTGFIGHDLNGKITTLGRGGSDLTATMIGASCGLDEIQVWKDVDGIMSCDPRMVSTAVPIDKVSFEEASELAYFGAKVLHPIAMQPAMMHNVNVRVKNSYNPEHPGTVISRERNAERLVTAITCKRDVQLIDIVSTRMLGAYGFLSKVFKSFESNKLSVDVLASSEVSISLTLDKKTHINSSHPIHSELSDVAQVNVHDNLSIITLIADVERSSEVLSTVFAVFTKLNIHVEMMSQGASKVNVSFIVDDKDLEKAIKALHGCFFEGVCCVEMTKVGGGEVGAAKGRVKV